MDVAELSIMMSQSKAQTAVGISLAKMVMDENKDNATQITEIIKNVAVDPNLGSHIDVSI